MAMMRLNAAAPPATAGMAALFYGGGSGDLGRMAFGGGSGVQDLSRRAFGK
jgi:hypothetical protein